MRFLISTLIFISLSANASPTPSADFSLFSYMQALYPLMSAASRAAEEDGQPIVEPGRLWLRFYQPPFFNHPVVKAARRVLDHVGYQLYPANHEASLLPDLKRGSMLVHLPADRAEALHYVYVTWRFIL